MITAQGSKTSLFLLTALVGLSMSVGSAQAMIKKPAKEPVPPADITPQEVLARLRAPFAAYKLAATHDMTAGDVRFWELEVFTKGEGKFAHTVVLIPEIHESAVPGVQHAAALLADAILQLPKVSIGVEEPVQTAHEAMIPNVAAHPIKRKDVISGKSKLFTAEPDAAGSVAYQLYVKQIEEKKGGVRFSAEPAVERPRLSPQVNVDMVASLAVFGPLVVYPVGAYHMMAENKLNQIPKSLGQHFEAKGFTRVR